MNHNEGQALRIQFGGRLNVKETTMTTVTTNDDDNNNKEQRYQRHSLLTMVE
jgi:hypothetical protein